MGVSVGVPVVSESDIATASWTSSSSLMGSAPSASGEVWVAASVLTIGGVGAEAGDWEGLLHFPPNSD